MLNLHIVRIKIKAFFLKDFFFKKRNKDQIHYLLIISFFPFILDYIESLEFNDKEVRKFVVLDCDADLAKEIIVMHVNNIYLGRRNFHFLFAGLASINGSSKVKKLI